MNNSYLFIALLLLLALMLTFFFPPIPALAEGRMPIPVVPEWARKNLERCARRYAELFARTSLRMYNVDPGLALALTMAESNCDSRAKSYADAVGLMQVVPKAWTDTAANLLIPHKNIAAGMWILSLALNMADQDPVLAIAFYNCSSWAVYADLCGPSGGIHFGEYVMREWFPMAQSVLDDLSRDELFKNETWISILYTWGYGIERIKIGVNWELRFYYYWLCETQDVCRKLG